MRDGWVEYKFKDVATAVKGKLPKNKNEDGIGIPYLTANFLRSSKPDYWIENIEGAVTAEDGDCLILWDGAGAGDLFSAHRGVVSSTMAVVTTQNSKILREFLTLFISSKAEYIKETCRGTTVPHVSPDAIANMDLKIPPLSEQKRIVDLISSVDSYVEALQQQLESAKKSRNAVLHELLTAGGDNWVETTLGEVAHLNPEQARDYDSDRLIKYIDLSTVTFDTGISTEIEQLPFNEAPGRARRIIREKDVIVSTVRPYLKGFAFVGKEFDGQIASTGFCVIRAKSESILPELIWALVGSDDFVDFLIRRSTGSNYPAVRPNDISDFTFMLPPLHDQETVSKLITTFDDTIWASAVLIDSAQNLRSGLLSDLLSGVHEIPASYDKVMGAE
jgi:type I restriction enzyme S subunit